MKKTGSENLVSTLANCGVTHCFANPGTSEMHLLQALDAEPRIKSVLCLFEGVATGAADGYARIADKPAITLLHLGPGYGNGVANIHNAMRANSPMINIIGDHATYHRHLDAPLTSDLETLITPHSKYIGVVEEPKIASAIAQEAYVATTTKPSAPVSIVLPANSAWEEGSADNDAIAPPAPNIIKDEIISECADKIKSSKTPAILVGGNLLWDEEAIAMLEALSISGVRILIDTFPARQRRGNGIFAPDKMLYFAEMAIEDLGKNDLFILLGTKSPVAFFAYPNTPSLLLPDGLETFELAANYDDLKDALVRLCDELEITINPKPIITKAEIAKPSGKPNAYKVGQTIARHLPENSIISDDAVTSGLPIYIETNKANQHDWLFLTGGAIGQGLSVAIGAQIARPDARVLALLGDGAAMYNIQALWTMGREKLPIITLVFANRNYKILNIEMQRTGATNIGETTRELLSLENPNLDFVALAKGHGIDGISVSTAEEFDDAFKNALDANKPILIEIIL